MHDSGVVAPIVADDGGGLAEVYDTYADPLYKYCLRMLGDPAGAADAVQDTFVIVAARPARPREPGRARAWLYAVARNECLRNLPAMNATPPLEQAPDVTDPDGAGRDTAGGDAAGGDTAGDGLRGLFDDAAEGLRPAEREALELQLRQGLAPAEVAVVLGVSRGHAHALLSRAREQLEVCLGALLTGRAGQDDCAELASMLAGWDGRLTVALRKRLHGHIEHCATCGARRVFELRPAMLRGLSPGAAMAAAAADSLRAAAGPPAALRAHTLALAAGQDPGAVAHRAAVLRRAGAFGRHGFPKPVSGTGGGTPGWRGTVAGRRNGRRKRQAGAAAAVLAVVAGAVAFSLAGGGEHARLADVKPPGATAAGASTPASAPDTASPTATRSHPAATPTPTAASTPAAVSPTSGAPATGGPGPTPTASRSSATSPSPKPPPPPSPKPPAGTLRVFPPGGPLRVPPWGATIWLSAQGGSVTWRVTVSPGHGSVGVSPGGGTLGDGGRAIVTITADQSADGRQVTVYPGGMVFTIVTSRGPRGGIPGAAGQSPPSVR